jgi:hypothetical protein
VIKKLKCFSVKGRNTNQKKSKMMSIELSKVLEREMKKACVTVLTEAVKELSKEYGFKAEEAMKLLEISMEKKEEKVEKKEKKEKKESPKIPLPYSGEIKEEWCYGMKKNEGLYSQCTSEKEEGSKLCKTCKNQEEKKGKPTYGYITDRKAEEYLEYRDEKGKKVLSYGAVLKKLKITREEAEAEAKKYGVKIGEDQYEVKEQQRGRPKKEKKEEEKEVEVEVKGRGRPKKEKKVVSVNTADDLIATLVANAQEKKKQQETEVKEKELAVKKEEEVGKKTEADAEAEKKAKEDAEKKEKKAKEEAENKEKKAKEDAEKKEKKAKEDAEKKEKKAKEEAEKKEKKAKEDAEKKAKEEEAKKAKEEEAKKAKEEEKEEEYEEEKEEEVNIEVKKFEYEGKMYLRASDNVLYDIKSQEPVGMWNEEENCIDEIEVEDDE